MAGIGFRLRSLNEEDTITAVLSSVGHAAVIAAGPWLFTIFSLATITMLTDRIAGLSTLATVRAVIIYAFASSLVLTAPIAIIATRRVADALWLKQPQEVRTLLLASYAAAIAVMSIGVGGMLAYFQPPIEVGIALAAMSLLVGLIWIALCFCGAIRDYRGVTYSFLFGLLTSLLCAVALAVLGYKAAGMIWGFATGLAITFFGMNARIFATFPHPVRAPMQGLTAILEGARSYWTLALGALLGTTGVWIDKWVFWFGSATGETVDGGLVHAPLYDSAMFIASLVIIPSLAAFVMRLETDFFDRYQQYYATIGGHGTLSQIETARSRLARYTLDNLSLISITQVGICAVLILAAPLIVDALGLQFRQIAILRYGALGAVFHFILIACTSMLLFFDRRRLYLGIQAALLVLNAGLAYLTLQLGEDFYGVGYFAACLICAFAAYRAADVTFEKLNFLTFIGNNPSVRAQAADATRGRLRAAFAWWPDVLRQSSKQ